MPRIPRTNLNSKLTYYLDVYDDNDVEFQYKAISAPLNIDFYSAFHTILHTTNNEISDYTREVISLC